LVDVLIAGLFLWFPKRQVPFFGEEDTRGPRPTWHLSAKCRTKKLCYECERE